MPAPSASSSPWYRMRAAHAQIALDDPAVLASLSQCWNALAAAGDRAGKLCCAAAACEAMHVQRRDFTAYNTWRQRLQEALAGGWPQLDAEWELRALTGVAWAAQVAPLDGLSNAFVVRRIDELLAAADAIPAREPDATASIDVALCAAAAAVMLHALELNTADTEIAVARALPLVDRASAAAKVRWLHAAGVALAYNLPGPRGLTMLQQARELAASERLRAAQFDACHEVIFLRLGRDGPTGLEPLFTELEQALDRSRLYDAARHFHLQCRRKLHDPADSATAQEYATISLNLLERSRYPTSDAGMLYTTFAYACARRGEVQPGLAAMERVIRVSAGEQQRQQQSIALFLRTFAVLRSEPIERARGLLQQAFGEANRMQWFGFRPVPEVASQLAESALRLQVEVPYVRRVIGLRKLEPPGYYAAWPWAVRIVTLGRFELSIGDAPLAAGGKVPRKTLDLLKYLAGAAGLATAADKLTATLWPELEGDLARGAFRTALHRLRKLLDDADAVQFDSSTVRLNATRVWVDTAAFERQVAAIEAALQAGESERARYEGGEAVALYGGHFLSTDEENPWMLAPQQRLRSRFARLIQMLGEHYERSGEKPQARVLYVKGLELDPLAEDIARRQMTLLRDSGEHAAALEVYRALRQRLSVELGKAPAAQTQRVAETLRDS